MHSFKLLLSCSFRDLFKLYCPGCGGTRAFLELLEFDILHSLYYNPLVILILIETLIRCLTLIYEAKTGKKYNFINIRLFSSRLVLVTIVGLFIVRNILLLMNIDLLGDILQIE